MPTLAGKRRDAAGRLARTQALIPELQPLMERKALALSGGLQKLVALARAMMVGERLLLLDEPTEGIAPALAHRILEILAALKSEGWSVFIAESNEKHLSGLTDALFHIERGAVTP